MLILKISRVHLAPYSAAARCSRSFEKSERRKVSIKLTSPCRTFQLLFSSGWRISSVCTQNAVSNRHLWINIPFIHPMFFWTNLNFWPPQYPVVVTPTINTCVKGKTNVLLSFFPFLSLFFFLCFFFLSLNRYLNIL